MLKIEKVKLVYFSATGTTRKILENIAEEIAVADIESINLTLPESAQKAINFGGEIKNKLSALETLDPQSNLEVPGRFPYEAGGARSLQSSPVTRHESCTLCGTCTRSCTTSAIQIKEHVATANEKCIRCSACIKQCPTDARSWQDSKMVHIVKWLVENCNARKEPQLFFRKVTPLKSIEINQCMIFKSKWTGGRFKFLQSTRAFSTIIAIVAVA